MSIDQNFEIKDRAQQIRRQHGTRGTAGYLATGLQEQHAIGKLSREIYIMSYDYGGAAALVTTGAHQSQHRGLMSQIEIRGGLV
jgi:hypothetical protein